MTPMHVFWVAFAAILVAMLVAPLWNSTVGSFAAPLKIVA
jgi:hypothetical protein